MATVPKTSNLSLPPFIPQKEFIIVITVFIRISAQSRISAHLE